MTTTAAELAPRAKENLKQRCKTAVDEGKRDMVSGVITIGRALAEAHDSLEKGEFVEFVESDCDLSKTTAYAYIKSFRTFGMYGRVEHFESTALLVLATCPEAAAKAKKIADRGNKVTHKQAKELVKEIKSATKPAEPARESSTAANPTRQENATPPAPAFEREPGDDTEAIEAEKEAKRTSGKALVSQKDRKEAIKALGAVTRFTDKAKVHEQARPHLEALLDIIKGTAA